MIILEPAKGKGNTMDCMICDAPPLTKEDLAREVARLEAEMASLKSTHEEAMRVARLEPNSWLKRDNLYMVYRATMNVLVELHHQNKRELDRWDAQG